ncbi:hypothetical protein NQZ68_031004 [Dissostichus eleginoides]|nr:hypothetical protein NQZ68_031004 [Dissostichus eleginoides]
MSGLSPEPHSHGKQTGARAGGVPKGPGPGANTVSDKKHKHKGPQNPQGCMTAKHRPP